ncbi:MAG TPA: DUF1501 domain-containing protein [Gemmataceae bacterium]|nr:DUF1501 domain-containing protein [Gemmataceae bacterium]
MLVIPGRSGQHTRDGVSRRGLLRVGGSALLGFTLADYLELQRATASVQTESGGPGFGTAKSVILLYLQGGPSQLDLWDPNANVPDKVRSVFKAIDTKIPGVKVTELLPKFAQSTDKVTLIRSMSYTPNGLLNHTAAIYEMLTGYTPDKVSPSGQLEPPSPKDFPHVGCNIVRLKPPTAPMLPFVMMPRPLQESKVIGKGGTAGFLGRAYDPYYLYPPGDDADLGKIDKIKIDDLRLRPEVPATRLARRAELRETLTAGMPGLEKAVAKHDLPKHYGKALGLVLSGRARNAFDLSKETVATRDRYGRNTFGQSCLLARRLIEAGTRFVEVNWPRYANADDTYTWDTHQNLTNLLKKECAPIFDAAFAALLADLDDRGLLAETLVVAVGEFGRSPYRGVSTSGNENKDDGRDHWPYCYTACIAGAGVKRGFVYGKSDKTASAPVENPVHPTDLLATIYHSIGIDPRTLVYNHLNQPRELVKGDVITGVLG